MTVATHNCKTRYDVKVRPQPSTANTADIKMLANTSFQISAIVPDNLDPNNTGKKWGVIFGGAYDGMYTALVYPGNSNPISTYTLIGNVPNPDPGGDPVPFPQNELIPDEFTLTTLKGTKATYKLVKILEPE